MSDSSKTPTPSPASPTTSPTTPPSSQTMWKNNYGVDKYGQFFNEVRLVVSLPPVPDESLNCVSTPQPKRNPEQHCPQS